LRLSSTPHDAEFLFRRPPYFSETSTGRTRSFYGRTTKQQHLRGVYVGVVNVPAVNADELGLALSARGVDCPTLSTGLRRVLSGNLDERAAIPGELVAEKINEFSPPCVADAARQIPILDHALDIESLDNHAAVVIGVVVREDVNEMFTLATDLSMQTRDASFRLLSVLGTLDPTGNDPLSVSETDERTLQELRVADENTVAVSGEADDATVDADGWLGARGWICHLDDTGDRTEPLVAIARDGTCLGRSLERTMRDDTNRLLDLGKMQPIAAQSPCLVVRFTQADRVTSFSFPARSVRESLKASLPSGIKLNEQLGADIAGNVRKPGEFPPDSSQLVDLIERSGIVPVVTRPRVAEDTLLIGKVPEEAQGIAPAVECHHLLAGRVDPKPKCLDRPHVFQYTLVYGKVNRRSQRETCRLQPKRSLGICPKIPKKGDHGQGVLPAPRGMGWRLQGLRVRNSRVWVRVRSRSSSDFIPTQGCAIFPGELPQGGIIEATTGRKATGSCTENVGESFLEPELLRRVLWWGTTRNSQTIRGGAARRFLPGLKAGVSAPEI
jgi:hypothetical protein